ncbi:hypothetical protein HKX48_009563 [Thoreauomyces humboldtii]|nr:hypothetical protein HKX48_009563 [Thoreauomyces humboldtii]
MAVDAIMENAGNMWKALDDMYTKNPEEYKEFMEKIGKEAIKEGLHPLSNERRSRPVRGAYRLACQGTKKKGTSTHFVNLCESDNITQPRVEDRITVVVSKARFSKGDGELALGPVESARNPNSKLPAPPDGMAYHVYDAVVHNSIIKEARADASFRGNLIELAVGCIEESFEVTINRKGTLRQVVHVMPLVIFTYKASSPSSTDIQITEDAYKDPYGWDDDGRPLDKAPPPKHAAPTAVPLDIPNMTPGALLSQLHTETSATAAESTSGNEEDTELPNLVLPNRSAPPRQGAILELKPDGKPKMAPSREILDGRGKSQITASEQSRQTEPVYKSACKNGMWVVEVHLPDVVGYLQLIT